MRLMQKSIELDKIEELKKFHFEDEKYHFNGFSELYDAYVIIAGSLMDEDPNQVDRGLRRALSRLSNDRVYLTRIMANFEPSEVILNSSFFKYELLLTEEISEKVNLIILMNEWKQWSMMDSLLMSCFYIKNRGGFVLPTVLDTKYLDQLVDVAIQMEDNAYKVKFLNLLIPVTFETKEMDYGTAQHTVVEYFKGCSVDSERNKWNSEKKEIYSHWVLTDKK